MGNRASKQAKRKPVLKEFSLAGGKLHLNTAEDVKEHVRSLNTVTGVTSVLLSGNTFGVGASKALASALELHHDIEQVNLSDCFTGRLKEEVPPALEAFGLMLKSRSMLTKLDLSDNALGPSGAQAIATFLPHCLALEELRLNNNGLGVDGGKIIAQALLDLKTNLAGRPSKLRSITIGRNRLENGSAGDLAKAFEVHSECLQSISMFQNGIRPDGIVKLSQSLAKCTKLTYIDLQDNTFTDSGSQVFAEAVPNWIQLKHLNIGDCLLGAKGSRAILASICQGEQSISSSLKCLNMQYGEMDEEGAQYFAEHLTKFGNLEQLYLNGNAFSATGMAGTTIKNNLATMNKQGIVDEWDDMEVESEESEMEEEESDEISDEEVEEVKQAKVSYAEIIEAEKKEEPAISPLTQESEALPEEKPIESIQEEIPQEEKVEVSEEQTQEGLTEKMEQLKLAEENPEDSVKKTDTQQESSTQFFAVKSSIAAAAKAAAEKAAAEAIPPIANVWYPVNTPMPNLTIHTNTPDPICLPRSAYPPWIFTMAKIERRKIEPVMTMEELKKRYKESGTIPKKRELRRANKFDIKMKNVKAKTTGLK